MTFDPNKVYGDVPDSFSHRVAYALRRCEKEETKPMKRKSVVAILITVLCLALATTAVAAVLSKTTEFFGQFYGIDYRNKLEQGITYTGGQATTFNDITLTLNDIISTEFTLRTMHEDGTETGFDTPTFFATGVISANPEANLVLMPRDAFDWYTVDSPAGYALFYGDEYPAPPSDALTYAELAASKGATICMAECIPNGLLDADGNFIPGGCGYNLIPQEDGTIFFSVEIWPEVEVSVQDCCQLSLYLSTRDVDLEGNVIEGTKHSTDWIVTLTPEKAE